MLGEKTTGKQIAEYYFEYHVESVLNECGVHNPRFFFERDYSKRDIPYTMFVVFDEWLLKSKVYEQIHQAEQNKDFGTKANLMATLPFDEAKAVFDIKGVSCKPLTNKESEEYKRAEKKIDGANGDDGCSFMKFYADQCRFNIESGDSVNDHSGVGIIELFKEDKIVARFYYVINFNFRKPIRYTINRVANRLNLTFVSKERPQGVTVAVCGKADALPCLKKDMTQIGDVVELDFSHGPIYKKTFKLDETHNHENLVFNLRFSDKQTERFYILDCNSNDTLRSVKQTKFIPVIAKTCPYCHRRIDASIARTAQYKSGAVPCDFRETSGNIKYPLIRDNAGTNFVKTCTYCGNDVEIDSEGNAYFSEKFNRMLPSGFMRHNDYKIIFTGPPRSGKTTYLSRFFDIDSMGGMTLKTLGNSLHRLGIPAKAGFIDLVTRVDNGDYKLDKSWTKNSEYYKKRAISVTPPSFPEPTPKDSICTQYPFIVDVGGKSYISFYDVAGEHAKENRDYVQKISGGQCVGVFFLVGGNGSKVEAIQEVAGILTHVDAKLDRNCPIAVILSKMDLLEDKFDSNSYCLRTDYFCNVLAYRGSALEKMIDRSSEEIRSYLNSLGLLPNLEKLVDNQANITDNTNSFKNVKYFGVSSFNFDSIVEVDESGVVAKGAATKRNADNPGVYSFGCSSKHMELPFVWMLRQFGLMK